MADRPHMDPPEGDWEDALRWSPAFSRSSSLHCRMVDSNDSISKRLESARGVVKNESRTFVTSRLSTFVSEDDRRNRRSASIRCSFMITAAGRRVSASIPRELTVTMTYLPVVASQPERSSPSPPSLDPEHASCSSSSPRVEAPHSEHGS